jgi:hypothetical protein
MRVSKYAIMCAIMYARRGFSCAVVHVQSLVSFYLFIKELVLIIYHFFFLSSLFLAPGEPRRARGSRHTMPHPCDPCDPSGLPRTGRVRRSRPSQSALQTASQTDRETERQKDRKRLPDSQTARQQPDTLDSQRAHSTPTESGCSLCSMLFANALLHALLCSMHTYIHTYIHARMHTYVHPYPIHTLPTATTCPECVPPYPD